MVEKIDSSLFSTEKLVSEEGSRCPQCGSVLVFKSGKHGPFKACSAYPKCEYIASHQFDAHVVKALGLPCPKCSGELVLRQGRFGMFIGCSSYPDCSHIEKRDQKSDDEGIPCPECKNGAIHEKKSRFGKSFYACDAYPKCTFSVNQKPREGPCESCGFPLILEKKTASGIVNICGSKACQHKQSDTHSLEVTT